MKKPISKEELLSSLPDFIAGRIKDDALLRTINEEIEHDTKFRSEFESLSEAYNTIQKMKFSEPPSHYFNSLLPRINTRIEEFSKTENKSRFPGIKYIFRYAIPAFSVVLVILIITFSNRNGKDDLGFKSNDSITLNEVKEDISKNQDASIVTGETAKENNYTGHSGIQEKNKQTSNPIVTLSETENAETIIEIFSENGESEETDEEYFGEFDLSELTSSEQAEILTKLENTNFK